MSAEDNKPRLELDEALKHNEIIRSIVGDAATGEAYENASEVASEVDKLNTEIENGTITEDDVLTRFKNLKYPGRIPPWSSLGLPEYAPDDLKRIALARFDTDVEDYNIRKANNELTPEEMALEIVGDELETKEIEIRHQAEEARKAEEANKRQQKLDAEELRAERIEKFGEVFGPIFKRLDAGEIVLQAMIDYPYVGNSLEEFLSNYPEEEYLIVRGYAVTGAKQLIDVGDDVCTVYKYVK